MKLALGRVGKHPDIAPLDPIAKDQRRKNFEEAVTNFIGVISQLRVLLSDDTGVGATHYQQRTPMWHATLKRRAGDKVVVVARSPSSLAAGPSMQLRGTYTT